MPALGWCGGLPRPGCGEKHTDFIRNTLEYGPLIFPQVLTAKARGNKKMHTAERRYALVGSMQHRHGCL